MHTKIQDFFQKKEPPPHISRIKKFGEVAMEDCKNA